MKRREFLMTSLAALGAGAAQAADFDQLWEKTEGKSTTEGASKWRGTTGPKVYYSKAITPEALVKVYDLLGITLPPACGVKISTGEPGGTHFLDYRLIKDLVQHVKGTIVECNTAYGGRRCTYEDHIKVAEEHGFTKIAKVDIMDGHGTMEIPAIAGSTRIKQDLVGATFNDYASYLVLSHFKGHAMGGFGGALKNLSIGFGSRAGKLLIHSAGRTDSQWLANDQDGFLEAMAEAAAAVCAQRPGKMAYVNVMNNLSVDCDCDSTPAAPTMKDVGILASLDPVAIDQAAVDLVYAAKDSKDMQERMETRHGIHTIEHAAKLGLGSRAYQLIEV